MRWLAATAIGIGILLSPTQPQAQIHDKIKTCQKSLRLTIACIVVEKGLEKVVDIALEDLLNCALGRRDACRGKEQPPLPGQIAEINANGIEWSKLRQFLLSVYKSAPADDSEQARARIAASCIAEYHPVCAHFGFAAPQDSTDCGAIKDHNVCAVTIPCTWKGDECRRAGTKELLNR